MIFVDTGAFFSLYVARDSERARAIAWWKQNRLPLVTTDYVIDESLTLLRTRNYPHAALSLGRRLLNDRLAELHYVDNRDFSDAWKVFQDFADKRWSFTDCTSKVVMQWLKIATAFTFDRHFRQFGNISVIP